MVIADVEAGREVGLEGGAVGAEAEARELGWVDELGVAVLVLLRVVAPDAVDDGLMAEGFWAPADGLCEGEIGPGVQGYAVAVAGRLLGDFVVDDCWDVVFSKALSESEAADAGAQDGDGWAHWGIRHLGG